MSKPEVARKTRRTNARRSDIIVALLEERVGMLPITSESEMHRTRMLELLDELKRSLNKNGGEDE